MLDGKALFFLVAVSLAQWAMPAMANGADGGHHFGGGWGGYMMFGPIVMILFFAAIVVVAVLIVRWMIGDRGSRRDDRSSALDILEERFARGEIDKAEFEDRRRTLGD